jgi:hypothetical protein
MEIVFTLIAYKQRERCFILKSVILFGAMLLLIISLTSCAISSIDAASSLLPVEDASSAEQSEAQVINEPSPSPESSFSETSQSSQAPVASSSETEASPEASPPAEAVPSIPEPEPVPTYVPSDNSNVFLELSRDTIALSEVDESFYIEAMIINDSPNSLRLYDQYYEYWSGDAWIPLTYAPAAPVDPLDPPNSVSFFFTIDPESKVDYYFGNWNFDKPLQGGRYRGITGASEYDYEYEKEGSLFYLIAEFEITD